MGAAKSFSFPLGRAGSELDARVAELRLRLDIIPPALLAERTGASYLELGQGRGEFHFTFLGESIVLMYPDFRALKINGEPLSTMKHALLMYYFITSDRSASSGKWISFAGLPDGRVYASAFQGTTGDVIAKNYGLNLRSFQVACESMDGNHLYLGDAAYCFKALPRLDVAIVYHLGDDDFPSTCQILFNENVSLCLPTEACAILGNLLAQKLLRVKST